MVTVKNILILALFFCISCADRSADSYFSFNLIEEFADRLNDSLPSLTYSGVPVYIKNTDSTITETDGVKLKRLYSNLYSDEYNSFSNFLYDALNQKVLFPKTSFLDKNNTFKPDISITYNYKLGGLKYLLEKYFYYDKMSGRYYMNELRLQHIELKTIYYYLFLEHYFIYEDDYSAMIGITPMEKILFDKYIY